MSRPKFSEAEATRRACIVGCCAIIVLLCIVFGAGFAAGAML